MRNSAVRIGRIATKKTVLLGGTRALSSNAGKNIPNYDPARGPIHPFIPPGDDKERLGCTECGYIKYNNPTPVAGVVASDRNAQGKRRVLLVRRGIKPRQGFWTIPGGFVEAHESLQEGAEREAFEEAMCKVKAQSLLCILDVPRIA